MTDVVSRCEMEKTRNAAVGNTITIVRTTIGKVLDFVRRRYKDGEGARERQWPPESLSKKEISREVKVSTTSKGDGRCWWFVFRCHLRVKHRNLEAFYFQRIDRSDDATRILKTNFNLPLNSIWERLSNIFHFVFRKSNFLKCFLLNSICELLSLKSRIW